MTGELIHFIEQSSQDLEATVNYVRAVGAVWVWGGSAYGKIRGYVGERQKKNIAEISGKIRDKIKDIPSERLSEPSPAVAEPLIEAAMQESRPELQDLWAGLLASAMLEGGQNTRYEFKEILAKMNPQDAVVFKIVAEMPNREWGQVTNDINGAYLFKASMDAGLKVGVWEVALKKLEELGCVVPSRWNPKEDRGFYGLHCPEVSPLGWLFRAAVDPR